ncbi:MAG TPA: class I SAM-dependent methyltransferase [Chitinophagaceae bacterium]|nr:class I SAM-dependent methyltransferase [Chitinophagaceae bacterium]
MIHYEQCPLCNSQKLKFIFNVKDYTVSGKDFALWECEECSLRFTQDIPGPDEIGAYYRSENYISHTETKKGFINNAYLAVRKFTLQQKKNLISAKTGLGKGKILDIGCGTGAFLEVMQLAGWTVQGLEPDEGARVIAEQRGVSVLPSGELFNINGPYDAITMWHVLEHVHDLHPYLEKMRSLLNPGGVIFIAVPNYTSADASEYGHCWAAYDVPRHLYHFSPASMNTLMKMHGLQISKMEPMWFDSFYVSMLSEKYRSGKNNLVSASWQGLRSNASAFSDTGKCSSVIYVIKKVLS